MDYDVTSALRLHQQLSFIIKKAFKTHVLAENNKFELEFLRKQLEVAVLSLPRITRRFTQKGRKVSETIPLPLRRVRWSLFDYSTPKDDYGIVQFFFLLCFSSSFGLSFLCKFNLLNFIVQATKPKEGAERGEKPRKLKSTRFYIYSHTENYSGSMESRSLPKL